MKDRSTNDKNEEPAAMKPEAPLRAAAFGEESPENAEGVFGGFQRSFPFTGKLRAARRGNFRFYLGRFVAELSRPDPCAMVKKRGTRIFVKLWTLPIESAGYLW